MANDPISYVKENKRRVGIVLLVCVGFFLIIISSVFSGGSTQSSEEETETLAEYKAKLEAELEEMCSSVEGVGKCKVMVTFERGEENTYKGSTLIESKPPKVMGITVVCRGADSSDVRARLTGMLTALFDMGSNRVSVLKLNS